MTFRCLLLLAALGCATLPGHAQDYPQRPIKLVVPFAPGGGSDIVARILAQKLTEGLGQQVVVDNRPGGGSNIAHELVARSAADGYTLLLSAPGLTMNKSLYAKLSYDPVKDFTPVSLISVIPLVFCVHPSLPVETFKAFVAFAKTRPGQLNYASSGNTATNHLATELIARAVGIDLVHIPYKGDGPGMADLIAGQVMVMLPSAAAAVPFVRVKRVRALAVTSNRRSSVLPEVPTLAESGLPGFDVSAWQGVLLPAGTPPAVLTRLQQEIIKAVQSTDLRQRFTSQGIEPVGSSPQQFADFMRLEMTRWAEVIKSAGIRAD
jgi:tripartite-type tricarboxylate transporter receptor subunit TctC